ncbi:MAG TPA: class I SAM-dependent methyltransferase [Burkholderiales bacterium]|nr:class I SAM-dependent methyltransferase [Burkholderiales bacterium]
MESSAASPSPLAFLDALHGYQRTAALRAAVELDLFSALAQCNGELAETAARCAASERGIRILCDYLAIHGFLIKSDARYRLTQDSAVFLVRGSPAYLGDTLEFLLSEELTEGFRTLTQAVRKGGTALPARGTMESQHPVWVKFARVMGPMIAQPASTIAALADPLGARPLRVLDVAAGHGLFGIAFAQRNPHAHIVAQDWAPVLEVAHEHARDAGVADRYALLPGDAFEVDFGDGYDIALLTNFLHHFDPPTCERLIVKVRDSLKQEGIVATLEFVPHENRVSPPAAAAFSLTMLATTQAGDAYTFGEYDRMFRDAGFGESTFHPLPPPHAQSVILTRR